MKKSKKAVIIALALCLCVCLIIVIVKKTDSTAPSETAVSEEQRPSAETKIPVKKSFKYENGDLSFTGLFSYSGAYVEDGTDEAVSDIAAIRVQNNSENDYQYADVHVITEDGSFDFTFTTLKKGESILMLEKSRKSFPQKAKIQTVSVENKVKFTEAPSLHEDIFELTVHDKVINIKNISDKDIDGKIYVYYKNTVDNGITCGITYRIAFDSLKAGELKQASSRHLSKENSILEFIDYEH